MTRPADFDDGSLEAAEFAPSGFESSGFADSGFAPAPLDDPAAVSAEHGRRAARRAARPATPTAASAVASAETMAAMPSAPEPSADVTDMAPNPGFAKNLTARPQNDEPLGAGWYISSWDLLQGCDVTEGVPVDQLPPEWQRKNSRT